MRRGKLTHRSTMSKIPSFTLSALQDRSLSEALLATMQHFDCQAGTIHLIEDGVLTLEAHSGIPDAVVDVVRTVPIGKGIAGLAAERRLPISLCNLQTDTTGQARPGAKSTGMEGSVAVPMFRGDQLAGVLGIAKATAHDWTDEEKHTLLQFGRAIADRLPNEL